MIGPIAVLYSALASGHRELPPARRGASVQEYMYSRTWNGSQYVMGRFPIVNGIVGSAPASVLLAAPVWGSAVGADASLYLTGVNILGRHSYQPYIAVYAPGATGNDPPEREIVRVLTYDSPLTSIAVDQQGYLYYPSYKSGQRGYPVIDVFAPGASGRAKYVLRVKDGGVGDHMSFDAAGNLYVVSDFAIDEWVNPHSDPVKIKTFCSHGLFTFGAIAVNAAGDLFAVLQRSGHHPEGIVKYAAGGNPCPAKLHPFVTNPPFLSAFGMAEYGGELYLQSGGGVYEILETGGHLRVPAAIVSAANGVSVGIGP